MAGVTSTHSALTCSLIIASGVRVADMRSPAMSAVFVVLKAGFLRRSKGPARPPANGPVEVVLDTEGSDPRYRGGQVSLGRQLFGELFLQALETLGGQAPRSRAWPELVCVDDVDHVVAADGVGGFGGGAEPPPPPPA